MYKFFDYLAPDLPIRTIRDLLGYIRRFAALFGAGGVPVEGQMDGVGFCATQQPGGDVRRRPRGDPPLPGDVARAGAPVRDRRRG